MTFFTFALLAERVLVVLLLLQAALGPVLVLQRPPRVQAQLQFCQSAVELQVQVHSAGLRRAGERLPRQEAGVCDQRRAGGGERGERGARRQGAHGLGGLREPERLDPGRLRAPARPPAPDRRTLGVSSGSGFVLRPRGVPPPAASCRHHFVLMYGGDGAVGAVDPRAPLLQEAVQLVLEIRVGQVGLLQVEVSEAQRGGGAQAGGGGERAAAGRQRAAAAAGGAGQRAGRQAGGDTEKGGGIRRDQTGSAVRSPEKQSSRTGRDLKNSPAPSRCARDTAESAEKQPSAVCVPRRPR